MIAYSPFVLYGNFSGFGNFEIIGFVNYPDGSVYPSESDNGHASCYSSERAVGSNSGYWTYEAENK